MNITKLQEHQDRIEKMHQLTDTCAEFPGQSPETICTETVDAMRALVLTLDGGDPLIRAAAMLMMEMGGLLGAMKDEGNAHTNAEILGAFARVCELGRQHFPRYRAMSDMIRQQSGQ